MFLTFDGQGSKNYNFIT